MRSQFIQRRPAGDPALCADDATTAQARHWFLPGDTVPWFKAPTVGGSPNYSFHTVAGRLVLMLFFGSASSEETRRALAHVGSARSLFDDSSACFFGISTDATDISDGRIGQALPGIRFFADSDRHLSTLFRAVSGEDLAPHWLLLDPALRVLGTWPLEDGEAAIAALRTRAPAPFPPDAWAPVLMLANVLEPDLCRKLIELYQTDGGAESGFMREVDGKTVVQHDPRHKQRRDHIIADESLRETLCARVQRFVSPAIARAFQFRPTRMERYLIGCYEAGAGHFAPHRDNTTRGTAHRRFAVTINLNAGEYEGGDLRFPEFGPRTYRAPTGGAVVFSCSLLHEATPVTAGRRYAFLPFLYDEASARIREENNEFLGENVGEYRMSGG